MLGGLYMCVRISWVYSGGKERETYGGLLFGKLKTGKDVGICLEGIVVTDIELFSDVLYRALILFRLRIRIPYECLSILDTLLVTFIEYEQGKRRDSRRTKRAKKRQTQLPCAAFV